MKFTPIYVIYSLQIYTINISRELYKINQIKRHKLVLTDYWKYPGVVRRIVPLIYPYIAALMWCKLERSPILIYTNPAKLNGELRVVLVFTGVQG